MDDPRRRRLRRREALGSAGVWLAEVLGASIGFVAIILAGAVVTLLLALLALFVLAVWATRHGS
jgi:hypothetical protein